jgi:hypothetical protein
MTYRFSGTGTTGGVEGSRTVVPTGADEARFTYPGELTLKGGYRFVRPLVGATMRRGLLSDLDRLRAMLESHDAQAPENE